MTLLIVIFTSVVSLVAFRWKHLLELFDLSAYRTVHHREYYRSLTHAFLHADYVHLIVNMLVLYSFGTGIEGIFDQLEHQGVIHSSALSFSLLYFSAIIVSSASTIIKYRDDAGYSAVGASGAVSAVVFTHIFFSPLQKIYFYAVLPVPGIIFGVLYLVYSTFMGRRKQDNINHDAHLWGALFGLIYPLLLDPGLLRLFIENLTHR
ncbi:MAG: rhomboid family intramembrane serine protease [Bacteroidota bacterium]